MVLFIYWNGCLNSILFQNNSSCYFRLEYCTVSESKYTRTSQCYGVNVNMSMPCARAIGRKTSVQECCAVQNSLKRNKFGAGENGINTAIFSSLFATAHIDAYTFIAFYTRRVASHRINLSVCSQWALCVLLSRKFWSALFILLIKKWFHWRNRIDHEHISYCIASAWHSIFGGLVNIFNRIRIYVQRNCIFHSCIRTHMQLTPFAWVSVVRKINSHSIDFYFVFRLAKYMRKFILVLVANQLLFATRSVLCAFGFGFGFVRRCALHCCIELHVCVHVCAHRIGNDLKHAIDNE